MKRILLPTLISIALLPVAQAQISITTPGFSYFQDFDTLPTASSSIRATNAAAPDWTDNSTLPGWYAGGANFISSIAIHNGSDSSPVGQNGSAPGSLGAFNSSDRAFSPLKQNRDSFIAVRMVNNSGTTIEDFSVAFTGEQWRQNADEAGTLFFTYQVEATAINTGTWTAVTQLNFTSPQIGAGAALDGNLAANQEVLSHTITGINLAPGEEVWFRWANTSANNGIYLAIDDLTITAIPEPSVYASVFGLLAVGLLVYRRRLRKD